MTVRHVLAVKGFVTIEYSLQGSAGTLTLTSGVLNHLARHRQLTPRSKEAGGQLFARFGNGTTLIRQATGPCVFDRATRFSFVPNRSLERLQIRCLFRRGFHYVGDWHTHPEPYPTPSLVDVESIQETFSLSQHELMGLVLVIVGTAPAPEGLSVNIACGERFHELDVVRVSRDGKLGVAHRVARSQQRFRSGLRDHKG